MKLIRIADLAGTDVTRLRADRRSRTADGELMHEHTAAFGPQMATLGSVRFRTIPLGPTLQKIYKKDKGRELFWNWTPDASEPCSYSGVLAEDDKHLEYHILVDGL